MPPTRRSIGCFKARSAKTGSPTAANLTNQRYSTLKQTDTSNVKQLKGAWMTRLKGSGFGGKYLAEATPLVKDGISVHGHRQ